MKKMSKRTKVILYIIGGILVCGFFGSLSEEQTGTQPTTTATTEQAAEATPEPTPEPTEEATPKPVKKTEADLDACCVKIAETLNETYKPKGFVLYGQASGKDTALYSMDMPYTTEEVKNLYAHDKQALRDLWGDIARATWGHLSEQGFEAPADIEVVLMVYAADNDKECAVYITKHDTKLKV